MLDIVGKTNIAKVFTENIENEAIEQIKTLLEQDTFSGCKIRIMPDVHAGKGCVIGFTSQIKNKVIPNLVGVDLGCGMLVVKIEEKDIDFEKLDNTIKQFIPNGQNVHAVRLHKFPELQKLECYRMLKDIKRIERGLGTLGGGNHFIEVGQDEFNNNYLIIHSGSRNLGKQVAEYYQNLAFKLNQDFEVLIDERNKIIESYKQQGRKSEIQKALADLNRDFRLNTPTIPKDLCFLESKLMTMYLNDVQICQKYASLNRFYIAESILSNMNFTEVERFETIHNYIENKIIRKGAVSAKKGEKLLIPINMRDGSIVAIGKGNEDWNCSAPHGAGRIMSRNKAREVLNMEDFQESMKSVFTTSVVEETIDEAPMAYKPIDEIIENIKDTVDVVTILKPVYNFKSHK